MIYFSELKSKSVVTEDQIKVGILEDLIFLASERANVTKLVLREVTGNKLIIPVEFLKKINADLILKKDFSTSSLSENELHLVKNILDKQIIDLQGNKIVRVNDIAIQEKDGFYIAGVDIGFLGILRWLKLENFYKRFASFMNYKPVSSFLSWVDIQPLELTYGKVQLVKEEKKLEKLHPEDLADYLEKTNILNIKKVLKILDEKFAAEVVGSLNIGFQSDLFKQFTPEKAARVLIFIDPDEAVDILLTIPQKKREQIINIFPEKKKKEIIYLMDLSKSPIGEIMTTEFFVVYSDLTVREVIDKIKKETSDFYSLLNVYIINKDNQLIGVTNLHEIILHDLDTPIYKFMVQNVIVVHLTTPTEIAIRKMFKYRLAHLPVIDDKKKILGTISVSAAARRII